jgi:uncharacterized protein (DUF302 family)
MAPNPNNGIVCQKSNHSVDETVEKLKATLQAKGVTLFALVDHSGEAQKVGLTMPPTKLLIFGNPKGGTPLMQAEQTIGIDLPLKALVWRDAAGKTWLSYNEPGWLAKRHGLGPEVATTVANMAAMLAALAGKASSRESV